MSFKVGNVRHELVLVLTSVVVVIFSTAITSGGCDEGLAVEIGLFLSLLAGAGGGGVRSGSSSGSTRG